jgi:hypothetical protein
MVPSIINSLLIYQDPIDVSLLYAHCHGQVVEPFKMIYYRCRLLLMIPTILAIALCISHEITLS